MKNNNASAFSLNSYEDLFKKAGKSLGNVSDQVSDIPISKLTSFHNHPFKVIDDERMKELEDSIKENGILVPGICRKIENEMSMILAWGYSDRN